MDKYKISAISVANTFLEKSFEENLSLTLVELNYLIFLLYADLLYYVEYSLFDESFIKTKIGPMLYSIVSYYNCKDAKITDFFYLDEKLEIWVISDNDEIGRLICARLEFIWNLHKYTYGSDLLQYLKENYNVYDEKNSCTYIDDEDILKDEINIHEELLNMAKKRCKVHPKPNL